MMFTHPLTEKPAGINRAFQHPRVGEVFVTGKESQADRGMDRGGVGSKTRLEGVMAGKGARAMLPGKTGQGMRCAEILIPGSMSRR